MQNSPLLPLYRLEKLILPSNIELQLSKITYIISEDASCIWKRATIE